MHAGDSIKNVNETGLDGFVRRPEAVLLFSSPWCSSCKTMYPVLEDVARMRGDRIAVGVCDISTSPFVSSRMGVFSVPTLILFRDGREVKRMQGTVSAGEITRALEGQP